jgi:hypothetical protein
LWRMAIILKANKVNLFVSSVSFVFWYHSPNFLDTTRKCNRKKMKECDKPKSHTNSKLHTICISSNDVRQPVTKTFTTLHSSTLHYMDRYSDWLRAGRSGDRIPVVARFPAPVQTGPGAQPASCKMVTGFFSGLKSARSVTLTPHPLLVPTSKNRVELYLCSP